MKNSLINSLEKKSNTLFKEKNNIKKLVFDLAVVEFEKRGGCKVCRGRGWIVTWDTLDSMTGCYHDSGNCTSENCTPETRLYSGLSPENNKYDSFHNGCRWVPIYNEDQIERSQEIDKEISIINEEINTETERLTPKVGRLVTVKLSGKGPKSKRTPIGTIGIIKRIFFNDYGTQKALVVDTNGKKWWPHTKYLEVINDKPDLAPWKELEKKELEETGTPVIATIIRKSQKAALIQVTTGEEMWIPIGQVPALRDKRKGETCAVVLPTWLAKNKRIEK